MKKTDGMNDVFALDINSAQTLIDKFDAAPDHGVSVAPSKAVDGKIELLGFCLIICKERKLFRSAHRGEVRRSHHDSAHGVFGIKPLVCRKQLPGLASDGACGATCLPEFDLSCEAREFASVAHTNRYRTCSHKVVSQTLGNIGDAFCEKAAGIPRDSWVTLEVSSFQLESVRSFHPKIAAVLNIKEDHLNRHYTMENYVSVKERIFANQGPGDTDGHGHHMVEYRQIIPCLLMVRM